MIEVSVTIHKNQISETARYRWFVNASQMYVEGVQYEPGTLRLLGFVGTPAGNQQYQGAYRFEVGAWTGDPFTLDQLPGIGITCEDESYGVHTHDST